MAEFYGTAFQVAVQQRMRARQAWIEKTPEIANGGRVLNFLEPEITGWDSIRRLFGEDGVIALTAQPRETALAQAQAVFEGGCAFPCWDVFIGLAPATIAACHAIVESAGLPAAWKLESLERPNDEQISAVQELNVATGVAPYPAFYSRGEAVPCLTTFLWNDLNKLVATASANCRYHPDSRLAGHIFEGSVSVDESCRGMGLGKLMNARVLLDSHERYGWNAVLAQVQPDNRPSRRMIEACGLEISPELVSIGVVAANETFTR